MAYYSDPFIYLLFTIDPGLGCISFNALVAFIVTLAVLFAIVRRSKDWPEAIRLHVGLALLSLWLITHWIDSVISHVDRNVTAYAQIYTMFTHIIRICTDVLVITGLWRIIIRYDFLRPLKVDAFADNLFSGVLWTLATVHIALLVAATGLWLKNQNGDEDETERVARARSALEVTYITVQFCAMLVMSIYACSRATERQTGCAYYDEFGYMAHAAFALLLRSFCEIVIVGQLDRSHSDIYDPQRARDVMYGLCSIYLVLVVAFAVPEKGKEDPLVIKDHAAVEEIKRLIEERIAEVTDGGKNTAPTMSSVLNGIEENLRAQTVPADAQQEYFMKLNEIARLRKQFANWEPVYKGSNNANGQNEIIELVEKNDRKAAAEDNTQRTGVGRMMRSWQGKSNSESKPKKDVEEDEPRPQPGVWATTEDAV
ncbi:uncharacterized protein LY89DRAFT_688621 [Mollisia scopiformis]|uniref:Uncharacterized protein n=1 Tax=Mollisia scopiformis TaxID=149040 RepID=A0A194WW12_MOLSC|nr:uncharacterized protein LY89DRAFT_688621 [Mollisia scopiformis]KUJ12160.1 hypothetical protein LY89DRAFT_688621 [Mollisia scopiformis]